MFVRTLFWLGFVALWTYLSKPKAFGFLEFQSGFPTLLGFELIAGSVGLYIWSARKLAGAAPISLSAPVKLLKRGPCAYVRNPLYLAIGAILAGVSTLYGAWGLPIY